MILLLTFDFRTLMSHRTTRYEGELRSVKFGRAELQCNDEPSSRLGNAHLNTKSLESERSNARTAFQQHV